MLQSKLKTESDLLRGVIRDPKAYREAFLYLALSVTCLTASVVILFIK